MTIVLQRVKNASVHIDKQLHAKINQGYLLYVGIEKDDTLEAAKKLSHKILTLKLFDSKEPKQPINIKDSLGQILVISQFTLLATTKKGHRPSYSRAEKPDKAKVLYHYFITELKNADLDIQSGVFGADMQVSSLNDGPYTLILKA